MVNGGYIQIEMKMDSSAEVGTSVVIVGAYNKLLYAITNSKVIRIIGMYARANNRPFGSFPVVAYQEDDNIIFRTYNATPVYYSVSSDDTVTKIEV